VQGSSIPTDRELHMGILKMLAAILVMASVTIVVEAVAQTQAPPAGQRPPPGAQLPPGEDQIIEGEVRSIDPSGTAITLTDGTRLITPPGATLKPGVLSEGMKVIASYREHNGDKVLTELALKEPSASPPTEPRAPATPPGGPTKRY
jgi:multidrug efflux pump subunit AcrA (membrane-fusion protein)